MTLWWAWWLANLARIRRPRKPVIVPKKPKTRTVAPYRRADGTDELRRIH